MIQRVSRADNYKFKPRIHCVVDKGELVGFVNSTAWCTDSKVEYGKDGKMIGTGWLRSRTWITREMCQGNSERYDRLARGKPLLEIMPWESKEKQD